jgi:hypothetical protein
MARCVKRDFLRRWREEPIYTRGDRSVGRIPNANDSGFSAYTCLRISSYLFCRKKCKIGLLEGVTLESLHTPEGEKRADEIFARNERILFPRLRLGRNQANQETDTDEQPSTCGNGYT